MGSMYVQVDGVQVHYTISGEGPNIILLHGLGASVISWKDNIDVLADRFCVYAVDLPGHGDSEPVNTDHTIEAGIKFVSGFMDAVGITKASIAGNSLGGLIALETVLTFPDRFDHLVLVGSAGLGKQISFLLRAKTIPFLGELLESMGAKAMLKYVFYDRRLIEPAVVEVLRQHRRKPWAKKTILRMLRQGVNAFGMKPKFQLTTKIDQVECPILVVWGREDRIFPVKHAYNVANRNNGIHLQVFSNCGHWPQMEKTKEFNDVIMAFLSE